MHNLPPIVKKYCPVKYCHLTTVLAMGLFLLVLSTTSCSKKKVIPLIHTLPETKPSLNVARLVDIPIPLGFSLFHQENSMQTSMLQFQGNKSLEHSTLFYEQEMDRLGWDLTNFSTQTYGLFLCEKRPKLCIINITQNEGATTIMLHINKKKSLKQTRNLDLNKKQLIPHSRLD